MRLAHHVVFLLVLATAWDFVRAEECRDDDRDDFVICTGCTLAPGDQCGDCDDTRVSVRPGAAEACNNGRDDDCDGATDGQDSQCAASTCPDHDADGYAVCGGDCLPSGGDQCGDCDDGRASVHPGRTEDCVNDRDDDCDGARDEADSQCPPLCQDQDGDHFALCGGDCNPDRDDQCGDCDDTRSSVRPGAAEACTNGRDDDCDGASDGQDSQCAPAICPDRDIDGYAVCGGDCLPSGGDQCGDCDDARASVRPGAAEACTNGRDDDCDGATDGQDSQCASPACPDQDADGWAVCSASCAPRGADQCGDCNDARADVNPDLAENCNGRDDDCDGSSDEGNPGGGDPCSTGQQGICSAGTRTCTGGQLQCSRNRGPSSEDCDDGEDDDCNGFTDEHDPACSAACSGQQLRDADHDAVPDCADNCPQLANGSQQDFDRDGAGDACETGARLADINRSGRVDGLDLAVLGRAFGLSCDDEAYRRDADLSRDCRVDGEDLALLATVFGR